MAKLYDKALSDIKVKFEDMYRGYQDSVDESMPFSSRPSTYRISIKSL
jgi:hypothetical protein